MALYGLAYNVRMAAYNSDGERVSGIESTITATLWADGVTTVLSGVAITEINNTGVYIVPLTAEQMTAYNLCITAVSSTAGVTFDPVLLDTEAGRIDAATSTRLAESGYTAPPTTVDVASAVWANAERTLTETPTYNGPTTTEIADAVGSVDLTTLPNADVGSLKTLALLQTNTGMTSERLTVYETDGTEHTHYDVTTDPDTGIQSVRIPPEETNE